MSKKTIDASAFMIRRGEYSLSKNGKQLSVHILETEQWIPRPIDEVFDYFRDEKNLETLTPDLLHFKVVGMNTPVIQKGSLIDYKLSVHGVPMRWRTEIKDWNPPFLFSDFQLKGPYRLWHHFHTFVEKDGGTLMKDKIYFALPFGRLGDLAAGWFVKKDVRSIFAFRKQGVFPVLD